MQAVGVKDAPFQSKTSVSIALAAAGELITTQDHNVLLTDITTVSPTLHSL
jgi:hypothetical protein